MWANEPAVDRQIEALVHDSYTFHVILQDRITVQVAKGRLTLNGSGLDEEDRALAIDTAISIRGVSDIDLQVNLTTSPEADPNLRLAHSLRRRLQAQRGVTQPGLDLVVAEGVVTLRGNVTDAAASQRIESIAAAYPQVRSVRNELTVSPAPAGEPRIDDASITALVNLVLRKDEQTASLHAQGIVHDGVVTLFGGPGTVAQKTAAARVVEQVCGVKSVLNRIVHF